jgi:hypothetical protein
LRCDLATPLIADFINTIGEKQTSPLSCRMST